MPKRLSYAEVISDAQAAMKAENWALAADVLQANHHPIPDEVLRGIEQEARAKLPADVEVKAERYLGRIRLVAKRKTAK